MLKEREGRWFVQGAMTMENAAVLLEQGCRVCAGADCCIDLSEAGAADSSSVAVVLGWARQSRESGRRLQVLNPPKAFVSLATLYGVDELLHAYVALDSEARAHEPN